MKTAPASALTPDERVTITAALPAIRRAAPDAAGNIARLVDGVAGLETTPVRRYVSIAEVATAFNNEPIVSLCQATQERCLSLLPTAQVIPRSDTGPDVTVLIEAGENGVVPLTEELERYWAEVDLVAGRPAWLGAP